MIRLKSTGQVVKIIRYYGHYTPAVFLCDTEQYDDPLLCIDLYYRCDLYCGAGETEINDRIAVLERENELYPEGGDL